MDNTDRIPVPEYYSLVTVCQSAYFWEAVAQHKMSGADLQVYMALAGQVNLHTGFTTEINLQEIANTLKISIRSLQYSLKKWESIELALPSKGRLRRYYLPDVVRVRDIFDERRRAKNQKRADAYIKIEMGKYRKRYGFVPHDKEQAIIAAAHEKYRLEPPEQTEAPQPQPPPKPEPETPATAEQTERAKFTEMVNHSRAQRGLPPIEAFNNSEE